MTDYAEKAAESLWLIAQIESQTGVNNAEATANTDGIDTILVGPNDFSTNMWHLGEIDHPDVQAAINHTLEVTHGAGRPAGIIALGGAGSERYSKAGFDFIATAADTLLLRNAAADTENDLG